MPPPNQADPVFISLMQRIMAENPRTPPDLAATLAANTIQYPQVAIPQYQAFLHMAQNDAVAQQAKANTADATSGAAPLPFGVMRPEVRQRLTGSAEMRPQEKAAVEQAMAIRHGAAPPQPVVDPHRVVPTPLGGWSKPEEDAPVASPPVRVSSPVVPPTDEGDAKPTKGIGGVVFYAPDLLGGKRRPW